MYRRGQANFWLTFMFDMLLRLFKEIVISVQGWMLRRKSNLLKNIFGTYLYQELIGYVSSESKIVKKIKRMFAG